MGSGRSILPALGWGSDMALLKSGFGVLADGLAVRQHPITSFLAALGRESMDAKHGFRTVGKPWGSEIRCRDWAEMRDNMDGVEWI